MDADLKKIIDETLDQFLANGLPASGEVKYNKQEPGGTMAAVNTNEASFRVYNDTLCPALWDEQMHLDPEVRLNLLKMAQDFYEKTKFTAPILDVYLMGSIANYNWTPDSDADVHVIIDFTQLQMPNETASKVAKSAGAQWNLEHNATVKGHKVEINIQSVKAEKPHVTGIYSLMKDAWIRKPTHMDVKVNKPLIQVHYSEIKKYVEKAIQSGDREQMKTAKDYLDDYRQHGLDTAGELSTQNIVYKILRAKGLIKTLKDSIVAAYDDEMSVDEVNVAVAPDAKDYIGSIIDGEVRGEPVPVGKSRNYIHNEFPGLISGMNSTNWRYQAARNLILWNTQPTEESKEAVEHFLSKRGITNARHKNMYTYEGLNEVKDADIKQRLPRSPKQYRYTDDGKLDLSKMTLDNLKALRAKVARSIQYFTLLVSKGGDQHVDLQRELDEFKRINDEMRKRMDYINKPVMETDTLNEMPQMSLKDKTAFAGDTELKKADVDKVMGNIVVFRMDKGGFFAPGYTLVYFMDSDESATAMKEGKLPYLMVPRGAFHSGGNPITDVWKKKYQKPGTEHILGLIEGNSSEEGIYVDMISVRPGWKRNSIASKMLQAIKKLYPQAKVGTSGKTDDGEKFFKSQGVSEGFGLGHNPEKDRLAIPNHRWQIRSKDAPKTPQMKEDMRQTTPEYPTSAPNVDAGRVDFTKHPGEMPDEIDVRIKNIVKDASAILDKKYKTVKFLPVEDVISLFDDLMAIHISDLPQTNMIYGKIRDAVLGWLAHDYDIRSNGKRIGERLNESERKFVNDLVDQIVAGML